ncbi:regulatory protein RecX [Clostridium tepidiprofundi DSM 19306]|uniref:Regulatory protein RecX n=1 Tax=Clostridium tepidiprofundi DSM 19306 TaxID=1121338 RepID=A0A151B6L2_9CLOT|nr:recombination regulator RecX [Clostridium tepidiprofundi]KYH35581.1 regulatory protein RecX [Clostridium tepidiprofundi DSM 19306]
MENNIITKVEIQKKNKDRVNIFVDDEFAFACSAELVYKYSLFKNKHIDFEYISDVINEDNYIKAKNRALRILEKCIKTEKEVKERLIKLGYSDDTAERVLKFLKEYDFINDKKYAKMFIKEKILKEGRNKIRFELLKKGVPEEIIQNEIDLIECEEEKNSAFELAEKRYKVLKKLETNDSKIYKKLFNYLVRRGYEYNDIKNILKDILKEDEELY